ncbi:hypothetical protein ACFVUN_23095 [Kitasatospora griseola]|uniref:hypothetical protein n=1 Tax=Kitasatospora griseola TaxID=2064 RepID=UPI0036DBCB8F
MEPLGPNGDFGISGLGMKIRGPYGPTDWTGTLEFITTRLERMGSQEAAALSVDAQRLISSTLSNSELEFLWLSTTGRHFNPEGRGGDIREFLADIARVCSGFLCPGDAEAFEAQASQFDSQEIRRQILEELDTVQGSLLERCDASIKESIVSLLERAVGELGADLGMRLFLRALKTSFAPIGLTRLARLETLGERLGYSDLAVADGTLNTRFDLTD